MHNFFYGWYLKCQSDMQTLAVIPAIHKTENKCTCSIQIITEDGAWIIPYAVDDFHQGRRVIKIGNNRFGKRGFKLAIHTPELTAKGIIGFGPLSPLKYDIMGPFSLIPFLECRHSVFSMRHTVRGKIQVNGQEYDFSDAWGYWEGDQGRSFPSEYAWTQCCFADGSLMLSVADIPLAGFHFTGVICAVLYKNREYRLATYLGAKVMQIHRGRIRITQGDLELEARLLRRTGKVLKAPKEGDMVRTIRESVACSAFYRFRQGKRTLFEFETDGASFEYEYSR